MLVEFSVVFYCSHGKIMTVIPVSFSKIRKELVFRYSVGNLVLPHQNSYLASGMGPNLVAYNFGYPQWILKSGWLLIESLGYGVPP